MRLEKANFDKISHGTCNGDQLIAQDGKFIVDLFGDIDNKHTKGEIITVVPLDEISICSTQADLSEYGFEKIGYNLWMNMKI